MNKTYAYNSIIIGVLVGLLVGVKTDSIPLAILACLGVSIVGFIIIRMFEKAVDKGIDKASDKITEMHQRRKDERSAANGTYEKRETTKMPDRK